jgi:hypothetical protein
VDVLAAAVNCTVPGPLPFAPDVMTIHDALATAAHPHDPDVFTVKEPEPPVAGTDWPAAESMNAQPPDCVTVNV